MSDEVFRFKEFKVSHSRSSMKVGVDGVLIGSWAAEREEDIRKVLDIGTGCGLIALIISQRFPKAEVLAIDIDQESVNEAYYNFKESPWPDRLTVKKWKFPDDILDKELQFDLIISNPPFFNSGISHPVTSREKARHSATLSVYSLLENAGSLLSKNGRIAFITQNNDIENIHSSAKSLDFRLIRECFIKGKENSPEKRVMMEFIKNSKENEDKGSTQVENLTLFCNEEPSERYRQLCKNLYLKF